MALHRAAWSWTCLALGTLLFGLTNADPSIPIAYCASINTSPNSANLSDFQSDGLCGEFCRGSYALAVVQLKSCWCSNYVPDTGDQVSTGNCDTSCPGYPSDLCGGTNLFGYLALDLSPSGTTGGSTQQTSSSSTASGTSAHSSTSDAASGSSTGTPSPTLQTVTAGGTVKTVTVTPTITATDSASSANVAVVSSSSGLSAGAAAGIAVGVIAVVGVAVGVLIWMWCRKRRQNVKNGPFDSHSQRASSSGMTGTPRTGGAMSENRFPSDATAENWDGNPQNGKRRSTLMPVDPRLDPFARGLYNSPNKSRESVSSLQDNQDYSRRVHEPGRVLRATNPDPEAE